jgi:hypothetical protein
MERPVTVAAGQMDGQPAPTAARLQRATVLVAQAAESGAQLVLLPELFNLGYAYQDDNYHRAEPPDGLTSQWLRQTAAQHNLHLAGSLLLAEEGDIYNSLLLYSPDGRRWRYDKQYPWAWERGYFRPGSGGATIARTALGNIGFLICWDTAHRHLWRQYAGQVELMLISSCPPDVTNPTYRFPGGESLTLADLGPVMARLQDSGRRLFIDMVGQQTAWLGVPAIHAGPVGRCRTAIPNGRANLLGLLPLAPWLIRYLPQAQAMELACDVVPACRVFDARGQTVARPATSGDAVAIATVTLPTRCPQPAEPQPESLLPRASYFFSDTVQPRLMVGHYRQGLQRYWGTTPSANRRRGLAALVAIALAALGLMLLNHHRQWR